MIDTELYKQTESVRERKRQGIRERQKLTRAETKSEKESTWRKTETERYMKIQKKTEKEHGWTNGEKNEE